MAEMVNFNLANPYQAQLDALARRQQMADIMAQQSLQPMQTPGTYNGIQAPISHLSGLAKILEGYTAGKEERAIKEERQKLGETYRADQLADMMKLGTAINAPAVAGQAEVPARQAEIAPEEMAQSADYGTPLPGAAIPAVQTRQAGYIGPEMMAGMKTPEGANQVLALSMAQRQAQIEAERRANEPYTLAEGSSRYQPMPNGLPAKLIAGGMPKTPFAPLDVSKFTQASITAAMKPDGTVDRTLLVPIPERRTGELGVYDEYARQTIASGKIPVSIETFLTNQKIAARPPAAVTYGSPVAATDAAGNPVFLQPGRTGNAPSVIQGFTPPAEKLRPIPPTINSAITANQTASNQLDRAIALVSGKDLPGMEGDVAATGFKGFLPQGILNRIDPQGVSARAEIADIGSLKLHDRSGAAVTAAESPRLLPFIPTATDDNATVLKKLQRLKLEITNESNAMRDIYSKDQGYRESPILNKPSVAEKITTIAEITDVAKRTGKTVKQVTDDAVAKGYKVNQ